MQFDALASDVLEVARKQGLMLTTAESCTGGLIAAALTEISGSSDVVERGFVTYSNAAKISLLGVTAEALEAYGAVSEPVARMMAEGALARSEAQIAVSVTGIAGPGGSDAKPEGRVCFGLAREDRGTFVETIEFGAIGRPHVRAATVNHALTLVRDSILIKK